MRVLKREEVKEALLGKELSKDIGSLFTRCISTSSCSCRKSLPTDDERERLRLK